MLLYRYTGSAAGKAGRGRVQALAAVGYHAGTMKTRHFPATALSPGPLSVLVLCLLLLPWHLLDAAELAGLYETTVPVASRDSERERNQSFTAALEQMLVRLTGRLDSTANPQVRRAIAAPQAYVEAWVYRSVPASVPGQPEQLVLQVSFFQSAIQRLLNEAGIPIWPESRPDTVLWVIVQDELGGRELATASGSDNAIFARLQQRALERGLPLVLPVLDFEDRIALRAEQLWNFDVEALRTASLRYRSESILALRLFRTLSGEVIGKAQHIFRARVREHEVLEGELDAFLDAAINLAAEELAANYAVLLSDTDSSSDLLLTVEGVKTLQDYASLLQYLRGLAVVNGVQVRSVEAESLELQLRTGGQFRQLMETIALDRRMAVQGELARDRGLVYLHYQWQGQ